MAVRLEQWSQRPDGTRYCFASYTDDALEFDAKRLLAVCPINKRVLTCAGFIEDTEPTYIGFDREMRERIYVWNKLIDVTPRQPDLFSEAR